MCFWRRQDFDFKQGFLEPEQDQRQCAAVAGGEEGGGGGRRRERNGGKRVKVSSDESSPTRSPRTCSDCV